ncbi:MAG: HEAT repeat domain-containing protein [Deltaproteobacteria bacterium]
MISRAAIAVALLGLCLGCGRAHDEALANLGNPDPALRAQAINQLGLTGNVDDLGDIVAHVVDPDPLVRSAVAAALGHFEDRRAADALAELVTPDGTESVQVVAVRSLAKLKTPRAHAYLLLAYRRDGSAVRAGVAQALDDSVGSPVEAVRAEAKAMWDELSQALSRGGAAERVGGAEELGRSGRPEAVARLGAYLGADSPALAAAAAAGLGASGQPAARVPLETLLNESDPELQLAGAHALGELGSTEAAPALAKAVLRGGRLGEAALAALASLPGDTGGALCAAALAPDPALAGRAAAQVKARGAKCDPAPFVAALGRGATQASALAALAGLGAPAPEGVSRRVASLLEGGAPAIRPLAARAAGALGLRELEPALRQALGQARATLAASREHWIKTPLGLTYQEGFAPPEALRGASKARVDTLMTKLAARGLRLNDDESAGPLFGDEAGDAGTLYGEAVLALTELGADGAAGLVDEASKDGLAQVRLLACDAAAALPTGGGLGPLRRLASDADLGVRAHALERLPDVAAKASPADREAIRVWVAGELSRSDGSEDPVLIEALGRLGAGQTSSSLDALTEALHRPGSAGGAALALGRLGTVAAGQLLVARLKQEPAAGLPELLRAVADLKLTEVAPLVRPLLFHVRPSVRAAAAEALVRFKDSASARDVEALREDYDAEVRRAAGAVPLPSRVPPATAAVP